MVKIGLGVHSKKACERRKLKAASSIDVGRGGSMRNVLSIVHYLPYRGGG